MRTEERVYFRDLFRDARHQAFQDSEGFQQILFALERLGSFLSGTTKGLGKYENAIKEIAEESPFANEIPNQWRGYHSPFRSLYELVRDARNDALHQGAYARHLTNHAVQLALIIEDALMVKSKNISDFMVREVVQAEEWQPVSFARQQMLANSYSYLPIRYKGEWNLISDAAILKYVHPERKTRLTDRIGDAISKGLQLETARCVEPNDSIELVIKDLGEKPVLVIDPLGPDRLVGITSAFDLL